MINRQTQIAKALEGKFILRSVKEVIPDLKNEISSNMQSFSTNREGKLEPSEKGLVYRHNNTNRFIDMRRRRTNQGVVNKKNYPIHNKPLFGYANEIVWRISFGFTQEVKDELMKMHMTKF